MLRSIAAFLCTLCILCDCTSSVNAQIPRINALFPNGGQVGTSVDVELRGASLDGANQIMVTGTGVTGTVDAGSAKADDKFRPLWQSKCGSCHELRSPSNRSLSPAQWTATVDRMVKVRNAALSADEQDKVTQFLVSGARAGKVTAKIAIAADAQPGIREMRAVTSRGVSTVCLFEVGKLPEVTGAPRKLETAQKVVLPCVANGSLTGNGQRDFYRFDAKKGQRLVFNLKGFRFNFASQMFFNPNLRLYDSGGKELVENHGYYDFDPLIDWICPQDGEYFIEVRDLLGRSNPGSIYRLTMGALTYEQPSNSDPGRPPLCIALRPDNVTLRPGLSVALEAIVLRRQGVEGEIQVRVEDLPPGVSAQPCIISPDRNEARLILSASPDAVVGAGPVKIMATGHIGNSDSSVQAIPQELYRLNNDPRTVDRQQCVVAVCGKSGYSVEMASPGPIRVLPKKGTPIKFLIKRNGEFKGPVTVKLENLPSGWVAAPETAAANKSEVTLLVRPDGNNQAPFYNRNANWSPIKAVLLANSDEFEFAFGTVDVVAGERKDEEK